MKIIEKFGELTKLLSEVNVKIKNESTFSVKDLLLGQARALEIIIQMKKNEFDMMSFCTQLSNYKVDSLSYEKIVENVVILKNYFKNSFELEKKEEKSCCPVMGLASRLEKNILNELKSNILNFFKYIVDVTNSKKENLIYSNIATLLANSDHSKPIDVGLNFCKHLEIKDSKIIAEAVKIAFLASTKVNSVNILVHELKKQYTEPVFCLTKFTGESFKKMELKEKLTEQIDANKQIAIGLYDSLNGLLAENKIASFYLINFVKTLYIKTKSLEFAKLTFLQEVVERRSELTQNQVLIDNMNKLAELMKAKEVSEAVMQHQKVQTKDSINLLFK